MITRALLRPSNPARLAGLRLAWLAVALVSVWALFGGAALVGATHVTPVEVAGNPACPAGTTEYKIEPVTGGTHTFGGFSVTITLGDGSTFSFTANQNVTSVIVKGGPNANVYTYGLPGVMSDTGLHAPVNDSNGNFYGLSHISFCVPVNQATPTPTPPTPTPPTPTPPTPTPPTPTPPTPTPPTPTPPTPTPPTPTPPTPTPPTPTPPTPTPPTPTPPTPTPTGTELVETPTPTLPVVTPTPTLPVVTPTPTLPVVTPTPSETVGAATPTPTVPVPTPSETVGGATPTPTTPVTQPTPSETVAGATPTPAPTTTPPQTSTSDPTGGSTGSGLLMVLLLLGLGTTGLLLFTPARIGIRN
jgi:hypothetical protein